LVSLIYVALTAEAQLVPAPRALPASGGASLISDDVLALRLRAQRDFELRRGLIPILTRRAGGAFSKRWMI